VPLDDYPELKSNKIKSAAMYFIWKSTKKKNHAEYMSLDRIENMFNGETLMMIFLVKHVYAKNRHFALGIYIRNQLTLKDFEDCAIDTKSMVAIAKDLDSMKYDQNKDTKPREDLFEPVSEPVEAHIRIPVDLQLQFIQEEKDVHMLEVLIGKKFIGVDSEWRPSMHKWSKT
jgi:hypothetical protein